MKSNGKRKIIIKETSMTGKGDLIASVKKIVTINNGQTIGSFVFHDIKLIN